MGTIWHASYCDWVGAYRELEMHFQISDIKYVPHVRSLSSRRGGSVSGSRGKVGMSGDVGFLTS
jgi:hypothetical protein